jgi:hypothetical protein
LILLLLALLDLDAPGDEAKPAPSTGKPAPAAETGDDWPFEVKVALFGIILAVIAVWLRFSRGQRRDDVGYEKTLA